jgi:DNA-binding Lrp family transcriptional regulator
LTDSGKERTAALIDLILLYGPSNYSQIARTLNLPEETVRYKINVQLPRRGLRIHAIPDYFKLGLSRKILTVTLSKLIASRATEAFTKNAPELYLTYFGKDLYSKAYSLFSAVPQGYWSSYLDFLTYFVEQRVIESHDEEDVWWQSYIPFRSDLFDFSTGEWLFSLEKLRLLKAEAPPIKPSEAPSFEPDYLDLVILSELQFNASTPLSKIAADVGESVDTIYYHYNNHIKARGLISQYTIGWVGEGNYKAENVSQLLITVETESNDRLAAVRKLFHNFPFSWLEFGSREGNYHVFLNIPSQHFNLSLHYLNKQLTSLAENIAMKLFDPFESSGFPLPLKMFDEKKGWTFNKAQTIKHLETFFLQMVEVTPTAFPRVPPLPSPIWTNIPI